MGEKQTTFETLRHFPTLATDDATGGGATGKVNRDRQVAAMEGCRSKIVSSSRSTIALCDISPFWESHRLDTCSAPDEVLAKSMHVRRLRTAPGKVHFLI